jgi:phenylacetate-coenzyme A ligase PaaK-like adenylate-forming protein
MACRRGTLDELRIEVEDQTPAQLREIADHFQRRLGLRVGIDSVPAGQLPRFEAKSQRFVDLR